MLCGGGSAQPALSPDSDTHYKCLMKELLILNPKSKDPQRWIPPADFSYLSPYALLPAQASEVGNLASVLPLAFLKDAAQPSGWSIMAVCGSGARGNEFIDSDGKWQGMAMPRSALYLPFALRTVMRDKALAAIDPSYADRILDRGGEGEPLYDGAGNLHPSAKRRVDILVEQLPHIQRTQKILTLIKKAGLIVPWPAAAVRAGGITLSALYTIDEKALHSLDNDSFMELRSSGALIVAYSCLLSLYQIRRLAALSGNLNHTPSATAIQTTDDLDLEFLNDSDTIQFGPLH